MVMDDLDTGTAADRGMDLAAVHGTDSVVVPGMADHGGKIAIIQGSPCLSGSFLSFY